MGRTVFAKSNAIMRKNKNGSNARYCGNANGWLHVIRKDQEGPTVGNQAAEQIQSVQGRAHAMLAHAKAQITSTRVFFFEITRLLKFCVIGGGQIRRAADEFWKVHRQRVQYFS